MIFKQINMDHDLLKMGKQEKMFWKKYKNKYRGRCYFSLY